MKNEKLLNSTQFAELCDVVPSTIKNWVDTGKIIPAQSVNGKYYFLPEQSVDAYLISVKSSVNPSFLALVCEEDDMAVENAEARFKDVVLKNYPNARCIVGLRESLKRMLENADTSLSEDQLNVVNALVVQSFISSCKEVIAKVISDAYLEDERVRSYPFSFFLDVLSYKTDIDSELLSSYQACKFSSKVTTIDGMRYRYETLVTALVTRHGLKNCMSNIAQSVCNSEGNSIVLSVPLACDIFYQTDLVECLLGTKPNKEGVADSNVSISFSPEASVANSIYKRELKNKKDGLAKKGIQAIYLQGYYSYVSASGSFGASELDDCVRKLTSGDYRFVWLSNKENIPEVVRIMLESLVAENKIVLINQ